MEDEFLSPDAVVGIAPGMTERRLADLRYAGGGPRFFKPTRKTVLYRRSDVIEWIEANAFTRTDTPVRASA